MVEGLDMTLDDIIKNKKAKANRGGFGGRGSGSDGGRGFGGGGGGGRGYCPGPTRRFLERGGPSRMMPYSSQTGLRMRGMEMVGGASYENAGTTLHVSNLDHNVTHADIKVLFSDVGDLKWYSVHYDRNGRPKGTAEVVFERRSDALAAIMRYNDRLLDGKRMKLVLLDSDIVTSNISSASHGMETQRGAYARHGLMRVQGRSLNRGQPEEVSAEALDADLEKYHEEAIRIK